MADAIKLAGGKRKRVVPLKKNTLAKEIIDTLYRQTDTRRHIIEKLLYEKHFIELAAGKDENDQGEEFAVLEIRHKDRRIG